MSGTSNVGGPGVYEAGDQRNAPNSELNDRERYHEGKENSHKANDSSTRPPGINLVYCQYRLHFIEDERSIANKLANQGKVRCPDPPVTRPH